MVLGEADADRTMRLNPRPIRNKTSEFKQNFEFSPFVKEFAVAQPSVSIAINDVGVSFIRSTKSQFSSAHLGRKRRTPYIPMHDPSRFKLGDAQPYLMNANDDLMCQ